MFNSTYPVCQSWFTLNYQSATISLCPSVVFGPWAMEGCRTVYTNNRGLIMACLTKKNYTMIVENIDKVFIEQFIFEPLNVPYQKWNLLLTALRRLVCYASRITLLHSRSIAQFIYWWHEQWGSTTHSTKNRAIRRHAVWVDIHVRVQQHRLYHCPNRWAVWIGSVSILTTGGLPWRWRSSLK